MKKTLILAGFAALMLSSTTVFAQEAKSDVKPQLKNTKIEKKCDKKRTQRPSIDEKLKLTEEQKKQAHDLRMQGHEKIKPVMEKTKAKYDELKAIMGSDLSIDEKNQKINALEKELLALKQEARKIRTENMKEFEAILTPEQKTEFDRIKKEAAERHKQHVEKMKNMKKQGPKPSPYGCKKCPKADK